MIPWMSPATFTYIHLVLRSPHSLGLFLISQSYTPTLFHKPDLGSFVRIRVNVESIGDNLKSVFLLNVV